MRLARPVVVFGLIVTGFIILLMNVIIPEARSQLARRQAEVAQNMTASLLQDGVFQHPVEGVTFFITRIEPDGAMRGLYLSDARSQLQRIDYTARSALIVPEATGPKLVMIEGQAQVYDSRSGRMSVTGFADFTYDLAAMSGPAGRGQSVYELPTSRLLAMDDALLEETGASLAMVRFELVSRLIEGFWALGGALIGFSALVAGGFSRLGLWREVVGAVVLLTLLLSIANGLAGVSMRDPALPWLGLVPLSLAGVLSAGLIGWAQRDRRLRR